MADLSELEMETFSENQQGIDSAVNGVTKILEDISLECTKIKPNRTNNKKTRKKNPWSDYNVRDYKNSINVLGRKLKQNPDNIQMRQKYHILLKEFKKNCKTKEK